VIDPATGEQVALHRHLAPALARGLGLEHPRASPCGTMSRAPTS
jgi:hypothetical protein